ncbi:MAG: hypothetical protein J5798_02900 [Spirochaetaceae bacterium]|nr:hypothetical protein [Spirochaetaceae bacterium]
MLLEINKIILLFSKVSTGLFAKASILAGICLILEGISPFTDRINPFCHGRNPFSDGMHPFCHGKAPFFDGMYSFHAQSFKFSLCENLQGLPIS